MSSSSTPYRSEEMSLYQLVMRHESAFECVSALGEMAIVQFEDINTAPNAHLRRFVSEVRRCWELERKLRFVEAETRKENIQIAKRSIPHTPHLKDFNRVELALENVESDLREETISLERMKKNLANLIDMKHILQWAEVFFNQVDPDHFLGHSTSENDTDALLEEGLHRRHHNDNLDFKVSFVVGIVPTAKIQKFQLMLWRVSRGNVLLRLYEIEDSAPRKSVFAIFFQGETFRTKVERICEGFHAVIRACPERAEDRKELSEDTDIAIRDLHDVIAKAEMQRHRILVSAAGHLSKWWMMTRKMLGVYHMMNQCDADMARSGLVAKVWVPTHDVPRIRQALNNAVHSADATLPVLWTRLETTADPPTYNKTNKFTNGFQVLIDSYGVASYRETNPALFTIITFPFLFAVMFGDMGHACILTLFAAVLIIKEKTFMVGKEGSEIWKIFFGGRYIILLMGLFSLYVGFIYNDIFSKSLNVFGSSWRVNDVNRTAVNGRATIDLDPDSRDFIKIPYAMGIDPAWQLADNRISVVDSYKMKLAILLGFTQMMCGVFVSLGNHIYFRKYVNVFCEFIPQVVFLSCLFGYLCILMVIKWLSYGPGHPIETGIHCAPNILLTFINMILFNEEKPVEKPCSPYMIPNQRNIQWVLLATAVVTVPIMLFAKPIILLRGSRKRRAQQAAGMRRERVRRYLSQDVSETSLMGEASRLLATTQPRRASHKSGMKSRPVYADTETETTLMDEECEEEEEETKEGGEMMIHQAIHTVEFVLGSVSHTASYLRLWALSLAHQQLSDVLWTMVLAKIMKSVGGSSAPTAVGSLVSGIVLFLVFAMWATLTVCVLVLMEGMSAFLHTLRLHWVEFQSKFYAGLGHKFAPFSFTDILETLDEERRNVGQ